MHYASVEGLTKSFGIKPLFTNISFHIEEGDKIALVASKRQWQIYFIKNSCQQRNCRARAQYGFSKDVTVALFEQEPSFIENKTILDNIFYHKHPVINAIKDYEAAMDSGDEKKLSDAIVNMDELNAWDFDNKVHQIFGKLTIHHLQQQVSTFVG